jgi:hypothetical protein
MTESRKKKLLLFIALGLLFLWAAPLVFMTIDEGLHGDEYLRQQIADCYASPNQISDPGCLDSDSPVGKVVGLAIFLGLIFGGIAYPIGRWLRPSISRLVFGGIILLLVSLTIVRAASLIADGTWNPAGINEIGKGAVFFAYILLPSLAGWLVGAYFRMRRQASAGRVLVG